MTRFLIFCLLLPGALAQAEKIAEPGSYTALVAGAVVAFDFKDIPAPVIAKVEQLIADSVAVAVGAHHIGLMNDLEEILEVNGGDSLILHSGKQGKLLEAVYLNAMAANMLDFDDSHVLTGHPGASIIQPALVIAQRYGNSREELIEAIVAGYEFNIRWSRAAFDFPAQLKGPWSSALLQAYGTTIATAKLLKLNQEQLQRAMYFMAAQMPLPVYQKLGLVPGQTVSALKNNYGQSAWGAVHAVLTARTGAQADGTVLDGDQGLWRMMGSPRFHPEELVKDLGSHWETLGVQIKPYAACRWMHAPIDGLLALREQIPSAAAVKSIDVYSYDIAIDFLSKPNPDSLLELQFSLPHVFGLALAGESLIAMSEAQINNAAALSLAEKVTLHKDDRYQGLFVKKMLPAKVVITLTDGTVLEQEVLVPKGEESNPIASDEHRLKITTLIESSPHVNVREYANELLGETL